MAAPLSKRIVVGSGVGAAVYATHGFLDGAHTYLVLRPRYYTAEDLCVDTAVSALTGTCLGFAFFLWYPASAVFGAGLASTVAIRAGMDLVSSHDPSPSSHSLSSFDVGGGPCQAPTPAPVVVAVSPMSSSWWF